MPSFVSSYQELRPIIVTIMESLGSALPRAYITGLVAAPTIVRQLRSPALRRAVRIESAAMFQLELAPLIVAFVAEQQPHAFTPLLHVANLKQLRERSRALPAICDMIGDSTTLYARCVEWLLHLYADNQFASDPAIRAALTEPVPGHGDAASTTTTATSIDLSNGASPVAIDAAMCADLLALRASPVALCALRFDLLMALHDRQQFRVAAADGAHGAAWLIDSCFRDGRFNSDVLARLRQCLRPADAARAAAAGTQQHKIIVADGASNAAHLAMVCASPSVRAQLLASIAQCLDVCASLSSSSSSSSSLSSDCTQHASLRALSDLLSLSSTAAEVVRQRGAGGFPQTSGDLVHVFYPAVVAWLQVDVPAASAGTAAGAAAVGAGAEPVPPPPAALAQIFAADLTCREVCFSRLSVAFRLFCTHPCTCAVFVGFALTCAVLFTFCLLFGPFFADSLPRDAAADCTRRSRIGSTRVVADGAAASRALCRVGRRTFARVVHLCALLCAGTHWFGFGGSVGVGAQWFWWQHSV